VARALRHVPAHRARHHLQNAAGDAEDDPRALEAPEKWPTSSQEQCDEVGTTGQEQVSTSWGATNRLMTNHKAARVPATGCRLGHTRRGPWETSERWIYLDRGA